MANNNLVSFLFIFGVICIVVIGLAYMMGVLASTGPTTDSYGNAPSAAVNNTTGLVQNLTTQTSSANQSWIWFGVLVIAVMAGMAVLWAFLGKGKSGGRGRGW